MSLQDFLISIDECIDTREGIKLGDQGEIFEVGAGEIVDLQMTGLGSHVDGRNSCSYFR